MSDSSPFLLYSGDSSLSAAKTFKVDVGFGLVPDGNDVVLTAENMLGELQSLVGVGILCVTGTDTLTLRSITSSSLNITYGDGVGGNISIEQNPSSAVQLINVLNNGTSLGAPVSTIDFVGGTGSGVSVNRVGTTATCTITSFGNPMTTVGDLILGGVSGAATRLPIGTNGQILKSNGTTAGWASDTGFVNPMTTTGDLILGGISGVPGRLAIGSNGQVLKSNGLTAAWSSDTGFANPMTTVGDLILGGTAGAPGRLAIGTSGQILSSNGTTAAWISTLPIANGGTGQTTNTAAFTALAGAQAASAGTLTLGGTSQTTYALWLKSTTATSQLAMDVSTAPTVQSNESIMWVNSSKVLVFTNTNGTYPIAFGVGATGSIPLGATGGYADLPIGTNGQVLSSNGTTASWQTLPPASNVFKGTATLSGGTVTVNTSNVTAGASIVVTYDVINSSGTISVPTAAIVPGVSFIINSTSAGDASTVNWIMVT